MIERHSSEQAREKFANIVLPAERACIKKRRARFGRDDTSNLSGLALSGGGIRSAVFCLGVIQALAKFDVLKNFDYLSTVSGGGYIGSSLTWFTRHNDGQSGVDRNNLPFGIDDPTQPRPTEPPGTPLLRHLRRHGSYLDPGGAGGVLPGVAVVLRGLVLNLLIIWLPIITVSLALVRTAYGVVRTELVRHGVRWLDPLAPAGIFAMVFTIAAVIYSLQTGFIARRHRDMPYRARRRFETVAPVLLWILTPLLLLGSLPHVHALLPGTLGPGSAGSLLTAVGTSAGLWSRLIARGEQARKAPGWLGPIGALLVLYGLGLLAYAFSVDLSRWCLTRPQYEYPLCLGLMLFAALLIGTVVNLNETTLHRFYRDRLMEAFMPDMDPPGCPVGRGARDADTGLLSAMCDPDQAAGPYHIISAHQVITKVDKHDAADHCAARWRIRGGDGFVFAPLYCGGTAAGWFETKAHPALSKLSLATAMAISGAAVNPDSASSGVGPQRNTLFAILMALLNIRLGFWLPNPYRHVQGHVPAPNHFNAALLAVLDRLTRGCRFVEVADGGNFENLAVYELLRREVRTILVCDAGADPQSSFDDLQNLLSRAEADFSIAITFDSPPLGSLLPSPGAARFPLGVPFSSAPFVVGQIRYKNGTLGDLYYLKPAIFADLRLHLLGFKGANPSFPDDTTVNQFFDEARFEAYRELGFACVEKMMRDSAIRGSLEQM